jgi:hypothetical protein
MRLSANWFFTFLVSLSKSDEKSSLHCREEPWSRQRAMACQVAANVRSIPQVRRVLNDVRVLLDKFLMPYAIYRHNRRDRH